MKIFVMSFIGILLLTGCGRRDEAGAENSGPPQTTAAKFDGDRAPATLQFDAAWVREPIAGQKMTAAYARIVNQTAIPIVISALSTPSARVTEMHEMSMEGSIMRMKKLDAITVPPNGSTTLEPGGLHLMVIDLTSDAKRGETMTFTAESDAGRFTFDAVVAAEPPSATRPSP